MSMDRSLLEDTVADLNPAEPVTIDQGATLAKAIATMRERRIGGILVTDDDGRLVGILSERDLMRHVALEQIALEERTAGQFMTPDPETAKLEHPLAHAVHLMVIGDHRHLPLVDEAGHPTGMVSSRDIVSYLAAQFREVVAS